VDELRAAGPPGQVLKVGDAAPRFALRMETERIVDRTVLLARVRWSSPSIAAAGDRTATLELVALQKSLPRSPRSAAHLGGHFSAACPSTT